MDGIWWNRNKVNVECSVNVIIFLTLPWHVQLGALTSSNSVEYLSMESCKDHCELVLTVKGDWGIDSSW